MMESLLHLLVYAVALILLTWVGNHACRLCLQWSALLPANPSPASAEFTPDAAAPVSGSHAGRWIGSLERLLIMLGLAANSWEVMVAVVALKTVARYQELDKRREAEYFLVGSLASILWAIIVTLLLLAYDREFGLNLSGSVLAIKGD